MAKPFNPQFEASFPKHVSDGTHINRAMDKSVFQMRRHSISCLTLSEDISTFETRSMSPMTLTTSSTSLQDSPDMSYIRRHSDSTFYSLDSANFLAYGVADQYAAGKLERSTNKNQHSDMDDFPTANKGPFDSSMELYEVIVEVQPKLSLDLMETDKELKVSENKLKSRKSAMSISSADEIISLGKIWPEVVKNENAGESTVDLVLARRKYLMNFLLH